MNDPFTDLDRFRIASVIPLRRIMQGKSARTKGGGAWLPWPLVQKVAKLRLRPASRWQVFLLLVCVSSRFGGRPAFLSVKDIADKTGLSVRTVKYALKGLITAGLVRREGRCGKLVVPMIPPAVTKLEFVERELPLPQV